ncbi:hypothetical protein HAX54_028261 [Datura stramonium]|uniref:Uncharacterized protein n=1 Tax=Datura stramonium TaxID=4076 RepID=A0ABS8V3V9_DATST|nr:hypothetical protein [Datura stramonium]
MLSYGGKSTLIKYVLQPLPIHLLRSVSPLKTILEKIEKLAVDFLWGMKIIERGIIGTLVTPYAILVMMVGSDSERFTKYANPLNSNSGGTLGDLARQTGQGHSFRVCTLGTVEDK